MLRKRCVPRNPSEPANFDSGLKIPEPNGSITATPALEVLVPGDQVGAGDLPHLFGALDAGSISRSTPTCSGPLLRPNLLSMSAEIGLANTVCILSVGRIMADRRFVLIR